MTSRDLSDDLIGLAWSLWAELGVSGWERKHSDWFVDPEPLILFTAWLGDADPRLRDEVTDWCVTYGSWVSGSRLQNLLGAYDASTQMKFGELAATVAQHSSTSWRGATHPRKFTPTRKSRLDSFDDRSLISLRLRGLFGVGARAEVMRVFLSDGGQRSIANLAELTGYKKRNLADALDSLRLAGALRLAMAMNRQLFDLRQPLNWREMLGQAPRVWPNWSSLLLLLAKATDLIEGIRSLTVRVQRVETANAFSSLFDLACHAELDEQLMPPTTNGGDVYGAWRDEIASRLANADATLF